MAEATKWLITTRPDIFPDSKPWLYVCGSADTLPWAEEQFD
jgi:hypothetical protein